MNKQKGITIIALIITIIVMLVLVGVSVNITLGNGLFKSAQNVAQGTEAEKIKEQELSGGKVNIANVEYNSLEDYTQGRGGTITESGRGSLTVPADIAVGDTIEYDCKTGVDTNLLTYTSEQSKNGSEDQTFTVTENPEWVVLEIGANGEILITPRAPVQSLTLYGPEGYQYGPEEIEAICEMYGYGEGATNVRSITIEDVNRISSYTPAEPETHTYKKEENGYISYDNGGQQSYTVFNYYDNNEWKSLNTGESTTLQHTKYNYYLGSSPAESVLINGNYWIPSRCVDCSDDGNANFYVRRVYSGSVSNSTLSNSIGSRYIRSLAVRPVVSIQSDIQ